MKLRNIKRHNRDNWKIRPFMQFSDDLNKLKRLLEYKEEYKRIKEKEARYKNKQEEKK